MYAHLEAYIDYKIERVLSVVRFPHTGNAALSHQTSRSKGSPVRSCVSNSPIHAPVRRNTTIRTYRTNETP